MRRIDALLADYAAFHGTRGNVVCHFVGIPLIIFGILALLARVPLIGGVTAAEVLLAVSVVYYLTLDVRLALVMAAAAAGLDALAHVAASAWIGLAAFAVGWVFQGIGHAVYEKKAPAFVRNLVHLMVGPLFLVNEALHLRPVTSPAS